MINTFPEYNCKPSLIEFMIDKTINLNRDDYPTIEPDGEKIWYNSEGKFHRLDGPARIFPNGRKEYWVDGKMHRDDGPAIIYADGSEFYCKNGKLHREDGPAVMDEDGYRAYYQDDKLHRLDGPAQTFPDGREYYFQDGILEYWNTGILEKELND